MTLLIGALAGKQSFNISDRLLTQRLTNGQVKTFDDTSNKTIVYMCSNGMMTISFTGTAYIHKKPTDQWVAEMLTGMELNEGDNFKIKHPKEWKNLGHAIVSVINELNKIWDTLPSEQREGDLGFLITVWQKTKKWWKAIQWGLKNGEKKTFKLDSRKLYPPRTLYVSTAGVSTTYQERQDIQNTLNHQYKNGKPESATKYLIETIRKVGENKLTVGSDYLSVRMTYVSSPYITIEYIPDPMKGKPSTPRYTNINNLTGMGVFVSDKPISLKDFEKQIYAHNPFFSPWIITCDSVIPP